MKERATQRIAPIEGSPAQVDRASSLHEAAAPPLLSPFWMRALGLFAPMAFVLAAARRVGSFTIDDAYISFRYARNFAHGDGLVYNLGERVEGYTNFLWTVILGLF